MRLAGIHRQLQTKSKGKILFIAIALEILIAVIDYATGPYLSFQPYYIFPIAIAAWYLRGTLAYCLAITSAVIQVCLATPIFPESHKLLYILNSTVVESVIFLLVAFLLIRLRQTTEWLAAQNARDGLTNLASRTYFLDLCNAEIARTARQKVPMTLAYADLDNFKLINDLEGHHRGDELLARVGRAIKGAIRDGDIAGRIGGDEFAFLLPNTNSKQMSYVLDRIRERVATELAFFSPSVGISIGATVYDGDRAINVDELLVLADMEMYKAKRASKPAAPLISLKNSR